MLAWWLLQFIAVQARRTSQLAGVNAEVPIRTLAPPSMFESLADQRGTKNPGPHRRTGHSVFRTSPNLQGCSLQLLVLLPAGHLPSHGQKQATVTLVRATERPAEPRQGTHILAKTAPRALHRRLAARQLWHLG
jgi:hypothetical protein